MTVSSTFLLQMAFHTVADLVPFPKCWRIKVRVIRLWKTPSYLNPDVNASIDMVLCDSLVSFMHLKYWLFFLIPGMYVSLTNIL